MYKCLRQTFCRRTNHLHKTQLTDPLNYNTQITIILWAALNGTARFPRANSVPREGRELRVQDQGTRHCADQPTLAVRPEADGTTGGDRQLGAVDADRVGETCAGAAA